MYVGTGMPVRSAHQYGERFNPPVWACGFYGYSDTWRTMVSNALAVGCWPLVLHVGMEGWGVFPLSLQLCPTEGSASTPLTSSSQRLLVRVPRCRTRSGGSRFSPPRLCPRQVLCTRALGIELLWCLLLTVTARLCLVSLVVVWRAVVLVAENFLSPLSDRRHLLHIRAEFWIWAGCKSFVQYSKVFP